MPDHPIYGALTFDTQTVMSNSFDFDGGLLAQLGQFKGTQFQILVTNVVASEIAKHLREKIKNTRDELRRSHKDAKLYGLEIAPDPVAQSDTFDARELARKRLADYLVRIGATVISTDDVPVRRLLQLYFAAQPPFASGKKKNEFPDAISLIALEDWAKANSTKILAISGDADWTAFGAQSTYIDVQADLAKALASLQENAERSKAGAIELLTRISENKLQHLMAGLMERLSDEVSEARMFAEADSHFNVEPDQLDLTLLDLDLSNISSLIVVQDNAEQLSVEQMVTLSVDASADFSFSVHDDGEDIPMGSASITKPIDLEAKVLISFEGNRDDDQNLEVTKVELIDYPADVHFGYIEPNFEEYDPEDFAPEA